MATTFRGIGSLCCRSFCCAALLFACAGCGDLGGSGNAAGRGGPAGAGPGGASEGPFGPPAKSTLLAPVAGTWSLDFEKTMAAQKANGVTDEQIAQLRKFYADNPLFGGMHADITITGNEAVGADGSEYRFFAMHEHDGKLCGKAWHHEDRFDPGDMSKCCVRLQLKEGELIMEIKMKDGLPDMDDPDLLSEPPAEAGSAATCDVDHPAGSDWIDEWTTYVFVRKK